MWRIPKKLSSISPVKGLDDSLKSLNIGENSSSRTFTSPKHNVFGCWKRKEKAGIMDKNRRRSRHFHPYSSAVISRKIRSKKENKQTWTNHCYIPMSEAQMLSFSASLDLCAIEGPLIKLAFATPPTLDSQNSAPESCSSAARRGEDVTVAELAAYLEEFVYIPKQMSCMAQSMYA